MEDSLRRPVKLGILLLLFFLDSFLSEVYSLDTSGFWHLRTVRNSRTLLGLSGVWAWGPCRPPALTHLFPQVCPGTGEGVFLMVLTLTCMPVVRDGASLTEIPAP